MKLYLIIHEEIIYFGTLVASKLSQETEQSFMHYRRIVSGKMCYFGTPEANNSSEKTKYSILHTVRLVREEIIYFGTPATYSLQVIEQLWVKEYHCCFSTRRALALDNPQRLICH